MNTVQEFNHELWETLELLKAAKQLYLSDELYRKIAIKLNNLQPPRPTCSTCKRHDLNGGHGLCSLTHCHILRLEPSDQFCCIHHSDYEVFNANK